MAYNEELAERIRSALGGRALDFEEKRMFGGLVFMVAGKMLVGVTRDELMARVGPEGQAAAIARPGVRPMDFTGRPMKGFVFITSEGYGSDAGLSGWLDNALAYTSTISAKMPKAKPTTGRRRANS